MGASTGRAPTQKNQLLQYIFFAKMEIQQPSLSAFLLPLRDCGFSSFHFGSGRSGVLELGNEVQLFPFEVLTSKLQNKHHLTS